MTGGDPMAEIKASFFIECEELLEVIQDGLETLETGDVSVETINTVFRAVHSIKGGAGAFELTDLVRFSHTYETVLDALRSDQIQLTPELIRLLFQSGDILSDIVRLSRDEEEIEPSLIKTAGVALENVVATSFAEGTEKDINFQPISVALDFDEVDDGRDIFKITFKPEVELFASGNEPLYLFKNLAELGDLTIECDTSALPPITDMDITQGYLKWTLHLETEVERSIIDEVFEFVDGLCDLTITQTRLTRNEPEPSMPEAPFASDDLKAQTIPPQSNTANPTVRVDLERVDRLINLVGELVINQSMLSQSISDADLPNRSEISSGLEEFMRLTRDIQDSVMMIRAQPVKSLFQRMSRIVRETSAEVGKNIKLITEGENTEIDKTVIDRLADPLTHMIRNAVDHGIENNVERLAAGKSEQGVIRLSAAHKSGRVIVEMADDGVGINREKVQKIAIEKGLIQHDARLSEAEIDNLLFAPGFSTAQTISNLSGRGVGMDVVRNSIQSLGGRIAIASSPGEGTIFTISLPLTLAVMDGMVVNVADEPMILPLNSIIETMALGKNDIEQLGPNQYLVRYRDTFIPLLDLGIELGYRSARPTYEGAVVLLIAQDDESAAAFVVDAIQDQRQVVIKGLEQRYGHVSGVAGATILGNGQVALILDPTDIISNASIAVQPQDASYAIAG